MRRLVWMAAIAALIGALAGGSVGHGQSGEGGNVATPTSTLSVDEPTPGVPPTPIVLAPDELQPQVYLPIEVKE